MTLLLRNSLWKLDGIVTSNFLKLCAQSRPFVTVDARYIAMYKYKSHSHKQIYNFSTKVTQDKLKLSLCGKLNQCNVGEIVTIRGFLQFCRMGRFFILRDSYGSIQVVLDTIDEELKHIPYESYLEVTGTVSARPKDQINPNMKTGEIEVSTSQVKVINKAKHVPFLVREHNKAKETLALTYRYLALRQSHLQNNLRIRSTVSKRIRDYLQDIENFVEITTPTLSRNTPGGAQEFVVPTQTPGKFYSLVQSPQLFKQLAIIGGFEKYFQFAICYRDEGGKPDRQPEFMQLDLEMANTSMKDVMKLTEAIIRHSWPSILPSLSCNFPKIDYIDALENYGVDKPDTRYEWKFIDLTDIMIHSNSEVLSQVSSIEGNLCKSFIIPGGKAHIKRKDLETWKYIAETENNLLGVSVWSQQGDSLKGPLAKSLGKHTEQTIIEKLGLTSDDLLVVAAGSKKKVLNCLGRLRILGADILETSGIQIRSDTLNFLWVVNFPLFEINEDNQLISCHHPFTAPRDEDIHLLDSQPEKVISQHYDLVLNGAEIAGGSIRIHDSDLQAYILESILKVDSKDMHFLLNALDSGAPPHGGIALGFDRYLAMILKSESIRDVMAFPKTSGGRCLMSDAPVLLNENDRNVYGIK